MENVDKKHAAALGIRVGIVFLTAVIIMIIAVYFMLSRNFQGLLRDYTIKIVESMTAQGVKIVETELEMGKQEVSFLADAFIIPESKSDTVRFPAPYAENGHLRMVHVTNTETITSDGRQRIISEREDITSAFAGEVSIYGPYFNEENEYVICYSAPIRKNGTIAGVLSIEKDGYRFCELIENIRFVDSGESYIINAQGTDIAVSDLSHIDWVNSQYNARKLYAQEPTEETKSIIELESKGLMGEKGTGTYYWNNGLCFLSYQPINSVNWVFLAGLRQEEIVSMTQSALSSSVSKGPVLGICLCLVFFLTALIIFWIISSMKKSAEINEKLKIIANYDSLTGLMNRNSYHAVLNTLNKDDLRSFACVYIDANGLHELNNHLGHQAGDQMLKAVADALLREFSPDQLYRIGGDEFVVLCQGKSEKELYRKTEQIRKSLYCQNYNISIGIAWHENNSQASNTVNEAEAAMQRDKQRFYQGSGNERSMRILDKKLEEMIAEKQDADTFLTALAPDFKGVYFVNLSNDTIRHLYIPSYFEDCLLEAEDRFSKALLIYARKMVKPEYYNYFEQIIDYEKLENELAGDRMPEFVYEKNNGEWLKVRILKFKNYKGNQQETLWIFANTDGSE